MVTEGFALPALARILRNQNSEVSARLFDSEWKLSIRRRQVLSHCHLVVVYMDVIIFRL